MDFNLTIPFITVTFLNAESKQKKFFENLFFQTSLKTQTVCTVTIAFLKTIQTPADYLLENNCFTNGTDFIILDTKKNKCKVNFYTFTDKKIYIEVEKDFDLYYLFTFLVEPLLIIWSASHGILFIHASGIEKDQQVSIFPAWRNTGKTNTILESCQNGFNFCGDDFCIIYKEQVYLYPKSLNIFSYNLRSFPTVYNYLNKSTYFRLQLTTKVKTVLYTLSQLLTGSISKVLYRISELAEVSTNIKVNPAQLGISICEKGKLSEIILLQKSNFTKAKTEKLPSVVAQDKILQTIRYELKDFFELYAKYMFLFPKNNSAYIDNFEKRYRQLLASISKQYMMKFVPKGDS